MKILNTKPTVSKEFIVSKFEKIHKNKSNSTVEKYTRVGFNDKDSLIIDETQTNTTDGNCSIIFGSGALYMFINNILPEEKDVTHYNLFIIEFYINKSEQVGLEYKKLGYKKFIGKLLKGEFKGKLQYEEEMYEQIISADFSHVKTFYLQLEDSNQNVFGKTSTSVLSKISQTSSSAIKAPINDSDTNVKDGFNTNDDIKIFLINTYYNITIELLCEGDPDMQAADKKEINITNIKASDSDIKKYNTLIAKL